MSDGLDDRLIQRMDGGSRKGSVSGCDKRLGRRLCVRFGELKFSWLGHLERGCVRGFVRCCVRGRVRGRIQTFYQ